MKTRTFCILATALIAAGGAQANSVKSRTCSPRCVRGPHGYATVNIGIEVPSARPPYIYAREPWPTWRPCSPYAVESLYALPSGYRTVTINGDLYYTYDFGMYKGRYFRALGQTDQPMYILPP